jgi:polar amino acid transport system substrate-binding protein
LARESGGACQAADPFSGPVENGRERAGLPSFGFRKADAAFREAVDGALRAFAGSPEHLRLIESFGFTPADLPEYAKP